jgi:hypothetical protein
MKRSAVLRRRSQKNAWSSGRGVLSRPRSRRGVHMQIIAGSVVVEKPVGDIGCCAKLFTEAIRRRCANRAPERNDSACGELGERMRRSRYAGLEWRDDSLEGR